MIATPCRGPGPLLLLGLLACVLPGCLGTQAWLGKRDPEPPPVSQAHAYWKSQVFVIPDPCNGGNPTPFLAGRLYLFGPDLGASIIAPGAVTIDLYDVEGRQTRQCRFIAAANGNPPRVYCPS